MCGSNFRVYDNFLDYMSQRVSFQGIHNRRKALVLSVLYQHKGLTTRQVYNLVGDCSYSALKSSVSRLLKLKYIGVKYYGPAGSVYSIRAKGLRFLYASSHLAPLKEWIGIAQQEVNQRSRFTEIKK